MSQEKKGGGKGKKKKTDTLMLTGREKKKLRKKTEKGSILYRQKKGERGKEASGFFSFHTVEKHKEKKKGVSSWPRRGEREKGNGWRFPGPHKGGRQGKKKGGKEETRRRKEGRPSNEREVGKEKKGGKRGLVRQSTRGKGKKRNPFAGPAEKKKGGGTERLGERKGSLIHHQKSTDAPGRKKNHTKDPRGKRESPDVFTIKKKKKKKKKKKLMRPRWRGRSLKEGKGPPIEREEEKKKGGLLNSSSPGRQRNEKQSALKGGEKKKKKKKKKETPSSFPKQKKEKQRKKRRNHNPLGGPS